MKLEEVLTGLCNSEINFSISSFWDDEITVKLGDEMNGYKEEGLFYIDEIDEIADWLHVEAIRHYPGSKYANEA